jgi:transposase
VEREDAHRRTSQTAIQNFLSDRHGSEHAKDAKRPHRQRENLVGEQTRDINRMKAALVRLGIRGFKPELRRAPKKLDGLRTPEGWPIPPNTLDEIRRDLVRLAMVRE